jgi:hypothetical protein
MRHRHVVPIKHGNCLSYAAAVCGLHTVVTAYGSAAMVEPFYLGSYSDLRPMNAVHVYHFVSI